MNYCILLLIKDTKISYNTDFQGSLIYTNTIKFEIEQIRVTSNIGFDTDSYILYAEESYLQFNSYNEIFNNTLTAVIIALSLHVQEDTVINITLNTGSAFIYCYPQSTFYLSLTCPIQYVSIKGNLDKEFQRGDKLNYSLIFHSNDMLISNHPIVHCIWNANSAFATTRPALVNKRFIAYNFSNDDEDNAICLCNTNKPKICHNKDSGPFYPGQTITFRFALANNTTKAIVNIIDQPDIACKHDRDKSTNTI